jgi:hypothetical protein
MPQVTSSMGGPCSRCALDFVFYSKPGARCMHSFCGHACMHYSIPCGLTRGVIKCRLGSAGADCKLQPCDSLFNQRRGSEEGGVHVRMGRDPSVFRHQKACTWVDCKPCMVQELLQYISQDADWLQTSKQAGAVWPCLEGDMFLARWLKLPWGLWTIPLNSCRHAALASFSATVGTVPTCGS